MSSMDSDTSSLTASNPKSLIDLPIYICEYIVEFINDSESYKNLRISCSFFYSIMKRLHLYYDNSHNLYKIISFKNGLTHGQFISFYNNNTIFKKYQYLYGRKDGLCNVYYSSGHIKRSTQYKFGIKNGYDITYFTNGGIKNIIYYKNNVKRINEVSNNMDGSLNYIIKYSKIPTKYVLTKFLRNKYKLLITICNKEIDDSVYIIDTKNSIKQVCQFLQGELHGSFKMFDNNNSIITLINYSFGKRHGLSYYWNNNTIEKMCNYKFNMLDGILKYWNSDLQIEAKYESNYLTYCLYYINPTKIYIEYRDNKPHGYYKEYLYDNKIKYKIKFSYGVFDNIYKKYYFTGDIQTEFIFHNQNEFTITNYDIYGSIKYKLTKKTNIYNIYHKLSNKNLSYSF